MSKSRFPQQLYPLILIFLIVVAGLVVARMYLVPETFGEYGHYRADAVGEIAGQEIAYAGSQVCYDCHDEIYDQKQSSNHKTVACEACHGPAAAHVEAFDEVLPSIPTGRGFCPLCHGYDPSRPSGFPQIIPERHNPGRACMTCHKPHNPLLPHAPEECNACHREIASQKVVSPHATLPCTQCHLVPEEHLKRPRVTPAEKPKSKELCGGCHARGADSPRAIPRIDLDTHGGRYLCWDCHYPHHPEAR